jgi:hypothetical protein|tara:strand:- start:239 stop:415 length:177 start_codon:yes stop_codon:yes gene_type:complete
MKKIKQLIINTKNYILMVWYKISLKIQKMIDKISLNLQKMIDKISLNLQKIIDKIKGI